MVIAGLSLAMGGGASASTAGPAVDVPVQNTATHHELFLGEEEISDVSLSTFYVFDKETPLHLLLDLKKLLGAADVDVTAADAASALADAVGEAARAVAAVVADAGDVAAGSRRGE